MVCHPTLGEKINNTKPISLVIQRCVFMQRYKLKKQVLAKDDKLANV